jgi:beta-hydroxylase
MFEARGDNDSSGASRCPIVGDHSTFMAPLNCQLYVFSRVPSKPYLPTEEFKTLQPLTDHWPAIRDEALRLYEQGAIKASDR